jgi:HEAT repeat protein
MNARYRFMSRRRLFAVSGVFALCSGLLMLHPYPRQSLFGPKIRGEPWCVWEDRVRRHVYHEEYQTSVTARLKRWIGVEHVNIDRDNLFNNAEMLPLLLTLAEDHDDKIRYCVLTCFVMCDRLHDQSALPVLRRRFDDPSKICRIKAAVAAWRIDPNEPIVAVLLREADDRHSRFRSNAIAHLASLGARSPEFIPLVARYATDDDEAVRADVMIFVQGLGEASLPVLRQGVDDRSSLVRRKAINSICILRSPPKDFLPLMVRRLDDKDATVRAYAAEAIGRIDKEHYDHLKAVGKIE